ncbi:hypothetical protein [Marinovum sp.]|uniref:hypothetical protein n=1 Tax=Marinovum sp. TaxID=2024839 RepID=UPI002B26D843|nr:hypothetical protein [Marinovum sp.]
MKKLMITAAFAASFAIPAVADQTATAADPFVSTQGLGLTGIALVGGVTTLVVIATVANADSSSGTD